MFSGIVEGTRPVLAMTDQPGGRQITVDLQDLAEDVSPGDSVSIGGVCLTVENIRKGQARFLIVAETLRKTTLGSLVTGSSVNIERSLKVSDRVHGHFVQGHVFGVGTVQDVIANQTEYRLSIDAGILRKYLAPVGSIAVDGVSLTIADVTDSLFTVALIPTTLTRTTLGHLRTGDRVNLEPDVIARQVIAYLDSVAQPERGIC